MVTDPEVKAIWKRHYTAHPEGRLPEHWAGPRSAYDTSTDVCGYHANLAKERRP